MAEPAPEPETRSHSWQWTYRHLWRAGTSARCPFRIADTVLFDGGDPRQPERWLFTSKDGMVLKHHSSRSSLEHVRAHFTRLGLADPRNMRGYVAVARLASGCDKPTALVIDQLGLDAIVRDVAGHLILVALQAFVHAKGGMAARYRCELVLDSGRPKVVRVSKLVHMGAQEKGDPFLPPTALSEEQAGTTSSAVYVLKSNVHDIVHQRVSRATEVLVRHLERMSRRSVLRYVADFICDENETLWFVGSAECVTTAAPVARPASGRLSRAASVGGQAFAAAAGGECPGDYCEGFAEPPAERRYQRGTHPPRLAAARRSSSTMRLDDPPVGASAAMVVGGSGEAGGRCCAGSRGLTSGPSCGLLAPFSDSRGEPRFLLCNRSIQQARLEQTAAMLPDVSSRKALLASSVRMLPSASYYRSVKVCAHCYATYVRLDAQRAQMAGLDASSREGGFAFGSSASLSALGGRGARGREDEAAPRQLHAGVREPRSAEQRRVDASRKGVDSSWTTPACRTPLSPSRTPRRISRTPSVLSPAPSSNADKQTADQQPPPQLPQPQPQQPRRWERVQDGVRKDQTPHQTQPARQQQPPPQPPPQQAEGRTAEAAGLRLPAGSRQPRKGALTCMPSERTLSRSTS